MHKGFAAIFVIVVLAILSAGCTSTTEQPVLPATTLPTPTPTVESPYSLTRPGEMALQLADVPSDYILKDRSDTSYTKMDQLSRDLGWRQGYSVTFYRMNPQKFDMTGLRQSIDIYPLANINKVIELKKDNIIALGENNTAQVFELPLRRVGDASAAYRIEYYSNGYRQPVYTILFIKQDVFETLEMMGGTTTDYETLKALAQVAADKIK